MTARPELKIIVTAKATTLTTREVMSRITPPMRSEAEFTRIEKAATKIEKSRPTKWYIGFVVHQTPVDERCGPGNVSRRCCYKKRSPWSCQVLWSRCHTLSHHLAHFNESQTLPTCELVTHWRANMHPQIADPKNKCGKKS